LVVYAECGALLHLRKKEVKRVVSMYSYYYTTLNNSTWLWALNKLKTGHRFKPCEQMHAANLQWQKLAVRFIC